MMKPDNDDLESYPPGSGPPRDQYESLMDNQVTAPLKSSKKTPKRSSKRQARSSPTRPAATAAAPSSYDPYSPNRQPIMPSPAIRSGAKSLIDDDGEESTADSNIVETVVTPGVAGLLEMEPEPARTAPLYSNNGNGNNTSHNPQQHHEHAPCSYDEPIRTSSGLLLTHRRTPNNEASKPHRAAAQQQDDYDDDYKNSKKQSAPGFGSLFTSSPPNSSSSSSSNNSYRRNTLKTERFEVENPWSAHHHHHHHHNNTGDGGSGSYSPRGGANTFLVQARRILSVARLGVWVSGVALFLGTIALMHSVRHETSASGATALMDASSSSQQGSKSSSRVVTLGQDFDQTGTGPDRIILVPFPNSSQQEPNNNNMHPPNHRVLTGLRNEFESWVQHHGKVYSSHTEEEHRFQVWTDNHHRTLEKNERHGPCKLTKQPVFGSNHFKDLTREEFKASFLKYTGPTAEQLSKRKSKSVGVLGPHITPNHHPDVHRRIEEKWTIPAAGSRSSSSCKWYDASCMLRYIFNNYFYGFTTIMEPAYDADSYPSAVDWRDVGAVTEVHSQGNCGACWAITAVETIESSIYLSQGSLYDLSETEVIVCAEDCEMCYGGWPQDAFDYVMDNNGIPLEESLSYDGDWLLSLSAAKAGESDELNEETVSSYMESVCPEGGSNDNNGNSNARYGNIEGYGYATDRCVCYTDGSGCDCDSQNEGLAVRNVATYGPAVVCLDASTWQDYSSGVITSASGCSQQFLDVNHCVQAVGYAYVDSSGNGDNDDGSGSGSGDSGSQDSGDREGYWIIRNQWSEYWGMNGYAYVAMGENTCGMLNDMVQVYA